MRENGVREARAQLTQLLEDAAQGEATLITRHGRPLAVLLPPEAAEWWEARQRHQAELARRQAAADERQALRDAWGSELVHPVAAVVRYHGDPASDDPLYLRDADQIPRPRRELRALVEQLRPDYRSWMVEAWYEDDPRRPSPDSARFRNTARHRYDWQDLGANNVLHLLDAEGNTLAQAEYDRRRPGRAGPRGLGRPPRPVGGDVLIGFRLSVRTGGLVNRLGPKLDGWHDERMDAPTPIDVDTWPRRQHFEHYRRLVPCTYSMTVELDVTAFTAALRRSRRKSYIAQVWALSTVVNRHDEFKMCLTTSGEPAVWPVVHPAFTVFNPERETFACVWAAYDSDFGAFHDVAAPLLAEHSRATDFFPQGKLPANAFDVSSLPWASFTGFNLNIGNGWDHLAPIFTLGRYTERDGRVLLPLAVQVHHAAADGFHSTRLVNELQALVTDPTWLEETPKA